jgi:hypothetical protein
MIAAAKNNLSDNVQRRVDDLEEGLLASLYAHASTHQINFGYNSTRTPTSENCTTPSCAFPLNVDGVWTEKFWCGGLSGYPCWN